MPKFKQTWDNVTVSMLVACLAAIATAVLIGWWCVHEAAENPLLWLVALVAALMGWVAAMIATPYDPKEKKKFSEFGKVVSGIITGFVLGKIGPLIDALVIPANGHALIAERAVQEPLLIGLASFLLSLLFVFGGRLYWWWDLDKTKDATAQSG
jgi:uncharacterized membrane protein YfcA